MSALFGMIASAGATLRYAQRARNTMGIDDRDIALLLEDAIAAVKTVGPAGGAGPASEDQKDQLRRGQNLIASATMIRDSQAR
jgi:hypothetical protein